MPPPGQPGADETLRRSVSSGSDNDVEVSPFSVVQLSGPDDWDPSTEKLPLSYRINDPNGLIQSGRIVYVIPADLTAEDDEAGEPIVVHRQSLNAAALNHGDHELQDADQWDGNITEGLDDRIGQDVTADLAPIGVILEAWNTPQSEPGNVAALQSGATDRPGEYLARRLTEVPVNAIIEASWTTDWCIPYPQCDDPDLESERSRGEMDIRLQNVGEGVAVRIKIVRINEIEDPAEDYDYWETGDRPERQPGLQDVTVQDGRALCSDGSRPYVIFQAYSEHYVHPGNNFYCFQLAFGTRGNYMSASERDYLNHEDDCMHMRFTVLIHRASSNLEEYNQYGRMLLRFFNSETSYYRAYLKIGGFANYVDWIKAIAARYVVIFLGHAAAGCEHTDHPVDTAGDFKDLFSQGFAPDGNHCPDDLPETPRRGGCGHKSHVFHQMIAGLIPSNPGVPTSQHGKKVWVGSIANTDSPAVLNWIVEDFEADSSVSSRIRIANTEPRAMFWNGGCRTILTTNLAEAYVSGRTAYYHGWTYSPACDYGRFCYQFFRRWIKGTEEEPAPDEFDPARIIPAYLAEACRGSRPRYHPRITDDSCRLSPNGPQHRPAPAGGAEEALA